MPSQSFTSKALLTADGHRIESPATLPDEAKVLQVNPDGTSENVQAVLEAQRNVANGFAGLNAGGALEGTIQHRVGTDAEIGGIVLKPGEFAYTTDTGELRIGDGVTSGGVFLHGRMRTVTHIHTEITPDMKLVPIVYSSLGKLLEYDLLIKANVELSTLAHSLVFAGFSTYYNMDELGAVGTLGARGTVESFNYSQTAPTSTNMESFNIPMGVNAPAIVIKPGYDSIRIRGTLRTSILTLTFIDPVLTSGVNVEVSFSYKRII